MRHETGDQSVAQQRIVERAVLDDDASSPGTACISLDHTASAGSDILSIRLNTPKVT